MMYVLHIPAASERGDAFVRRGASPDGPGAWLILPILPRRRRADGHWEYAVPSTVETFPSPCAAREWLRQRKVWQKAKGIRPAVCGAIRILRVDEVRAPVEVW